MAAELIVASEAEHDIAEAYGSSTTEASWNNRGLPQAGRRDTG